MYIQIILLTVVATLSSGWIWHPITWPMIYPLVSGFFVGLILGDPITGMAAGAYINLVYLGWITAGGAMPGNIMFAGVFGAALTIIAGVEPIMAPALAIPLALAGLLVWQLQMTVNAVWVHRADRYADSGNIRGVELCTYLYPQLTVFVLHLVPAFLLLYFGSGFETVVQGIPESLVDALTVVGGMMPALGIAMLLHYLGKPKLIPLFFIGFFAALYLNLGLMAIALFGGLLGIYTYMSKPGTISAAEGDDEDEQIELVHKLQKKDLIKHWLRGYSQEAAYNFERLQASGTCAAMAPIIRRLYSSKEDISAALKRYLVFFNTEPGFIGPCIPGVVASMEEQRSNGAQISDDDINSFRTGLMGPMAGIGDTVAQGILYPTLAAITATMAIEGNAMGPILFTLIYGGAMLIIGYFTYMLGYSRGKLAITSILKSDMLSRITEAFAIVGLMVVGAMGAERVLLSMPLELTIGETAINFQEILDGLLPNLLPLAVILIAYLLIRKKVSPIAIIIGMFAVGIAGTYLGILAP